MSNINEKRYPNINDAVAFNIAFAPMICTYGSVGWDEILHTKCSCCGLTEQVSDFLAQKSDCQKKRWCYFRHISLWRQHNNS